MDGTSILARVLTAGGSAYSHKVTSVRWRDFNCSALEDNYCFFPQGISFCVGCWESSQNVPLCLLHTQLSLALLARSGLEALLCFLGNVFCLLLWFPASHCPFVHTAHLVYCVVFCSYHVTYCAVHSPQALCEGFLLLPSPRGIISGYIRDWG